MGQTPNLKLPYPEPTDTADVPRDIKALADRLELIEGNVGTSLPGTPTDGQEFYYIADATNGIIWRFRYRSASASAYKWEFVGGSPLRATILTDETFAEGANFVDPATAGPIITFPFKGDYRYEVHANMYVLTQSAPAAGAVGVSSNGAQPALPDIASIFVTSGVGVAATKPGTLIGRAAADIAKVMYQVQAVAGGTAHVRSRELQITPIRVG